MLVYHVKDHVQYRRADLVLGALERAVDLVEEEGGHEVGDGGDLLGAGRRRPLIGEVDGLDVLPSLVQGDVDLAEEAQVLGGQADRGEQAEDGAEVQRHVGLNQDRLPQPQGIVVLAGLVTSRRRQVYIASALSTRMALTVGLGGDLPELLEKVVHPYLGGGI